MAPHSSTLAWKIPWTEEPGKLQTMGSLRVGHDWATSLSLFTFMHWRRKWQPTPVFLPGESQRWGSLVGFRPWGRTESETTEVTQQQEQQLLIHQKFDDVYLYELSRISSLQFSSVQSLSRVRLFATPWIAAFQASLSITNSRSSLRLTSIESVTPFSHLILWCPLLLLPPIPPSIRVFSNESTLLFPNHLLNFLVMFINFPLWFKLPYICIQIWLTSGLSWSIDLCVHFTINIIQFSLVKL